MEASAFLNADAFDEFIPKERLRPHSCAEQIPSIVQQLFPCLLVITIQNRAIR